jgi:choline dehydrogenase-like flavoprotein
MYIDARNLAQNTLIEGDICIVGAGTAGISMALDWKDKPYKVILLEGGGLEYDDEVQDLYDGTTSGQRYYPLRSSRLHLFGGTTGHWAGMCAPFDPIDFSKRDWVPNSGWPITLEDLNPYYMRANAKLDLEEHPYELEYWQKQIDGMIPYQLDPDIVWNKMWQFSNSRFNQDRREDILKARNIHLFTYANVTDIKANEAVNTIEEVTIKNHIGKTHTVRAKYFILACGAVQNARMLLASNHQAKAGLGNDKDQVGRYFMEHLEIDSAELWLTKPLSWKLYKWDWENGTLSRAELAITSEAQTRYQILNGTASLSPLKVAQNMKPRMDVWQNKDPRKSGELTMDAFREAERKGKEAGAHLKNRAFHLQTRVEQAPNPRSRVTLGKEKDALGVRKAHLHWEMTELDKRSMRTMYYILGRQFGVADIGRIKLMDFLQDENDHSWPDYTNGGWHHMGTTRMSSDPATGVVDANCQVFGLSNLFIAGSGCFSTAGAPNPTLTLVALSLRTSDYVMSLL